MSIGHLGKDPQLKGPRVRYTRVLKKPTGGRRSLAGAVGMHTFTKRNSVRNVAKDLKKQGFLPPRHQRCPSCGGRLRRGAWLKDAATYFMRCGSKGCHVDRIHPLHNHPLFQYGPISLDVGTQTTILSGLVHGMKSADIHIQTGASHSTIERMHSRLRAHIADYMDKKQEEIGFGPGYVDVEVDEAHNSIGLGDTLCCV